MKCSLAYSLLADVQCSLDWLENQDNPSKRRILWIASISMLNTISDVLDRDPDKEVRKWIQDARLRWKQEAKDGRNIFEHFIRIERNNLNHEWLHGHSDDAPIFLVVKEDEGAEEQAFGNFNHLYWPMENGPFAGEDARDVLKWSIDWWRSELEKMERA